MKTMIIAMGCALLAAGCNQNGGEGNSVDQNPPVTGRGSGQGGDSGGNGKVYDRGGAPDSANPTRQRPGSGRVDQGGGTTSGGPIDNSVPATNANSRTNVPGANTPDAGTP